MLRVGIASGPRSQPTVSRQIALLLRPDISGRLRLAKGAFRDEEEKELAWRACLVSASTRSGLLSGQGS